MSDLLNSASLVMIPSGYKEDILYSEIPTDGSGDMAFTRASNGTRVNSAGLVEVCPWNLCDYSEDQTQWTSQNETTVTANSTTAPNGTLTADTVTPTAVNDDHYRGIGLSSQVGALTAFIYVKPNGYNFFDWGIWNGSQYIVRATFDLVNLTYTFTNAGTATIESVGNGWLKCGISGTNASLSTINLYYRVRPTGGTGAFTGNGTSGAYIWGAQLNIGSTAKPYFPTTDRLNVPRLTYQNGGGGCPSLLLEKQSTNSFLYSEQFDNAAWIGDRRTITANNATSPDGTQNADLFTPTATLGSHNINPSTLISFLSSAGTFSVFAKYNGYNLSLSIAGSGANWTGCVFDLQNGIARTPQSAGAQSPCTAKIEDFGNGWYRCSISYTSYTTGTFYTFIGATSTNNSTLGSYGLEDFTANGTSGFYLYGAQIETASSYPTSYIPTTSSSATRVADACFKTGISSLIGQTQGTLFVDVTEEAKNDGRYMFVSDGSASNRIVIYQSGGAINVYCSAGGAFNITYSPPAGRLKIAFVYKSNDYALWVNGIERTTVTTISAVPTGLNATGIGSSEGSIGTPEPIDAGVNQAILFPTRLTNAELASLTTI